MSKQHKPKWDCSKTSDGVHVTEGGPYVWTQYLSGKATEEQVAKASHCSLCGMVIW